MKPKEMKRIIHNQNVIDFSEGIKLQYRRKGSSMWIDSKNYRFSDFSNSDIEIRRKPIPASGVFIEFDIDGSKSYVQYSDRHQAEQEVVKIKENSNSANPGERYRARVVLLEEKE